MREGEKTAAAAERNVSPWDGERENLPEENEAREDANGSGGDGGGCFDALGLLLSLPLSPFPAHFRRRGADTTYAAAECESVLCPLSPFTSAATSTEQGESLTPDDHAVVVVALPPSPPPRNHTTLTGEDREEYRVHQIANL